MCAHRSRVGDKVTRSMHMVNGAKIKINSFWPRLKEGNHRSTGKKKYKTTHIQNILSFNKHTSFVPMLVHFQAYMRTLSLEMMNLTKQCLKM